MSTPRHVLIIGGGIAGPVLALFLQRAGISSTIYEAQPDNAEVRGAFLGLSINGAEILRELGIVQTVRDYGFPALGMTFLNHEGKMVGQIGGTTTTPDTEQITIKRGLLHKALRDEVVRRGIPIEFSKKLKGIQQTAHSVTATFEDGTSATGDLLIGCDGIHSRTRQLVLPNSPTPQYTGLIDYGGFAQGVGLPYTPTTQMVFGRKGFFGYSVAPDGTVYWFGNYGQAQEPKRGELEAIPDSEWRNCLHNLYAGELPLIHTIISATKNVSERYPLRDLATLPTWHTGNVCLIGDAAHATTPHAGQGASIAMEDAMLLAKCLRDIPEVERAFATFQSLRKPRVEAIVKMARQTGNSKAMSNPVALWFRDTMLPFFLKLGAGAMAKTVAYRIDWEMPMDGREARVKQVA